MAKVHTSFTQVEVQILMFKNTFWGETFHTQSKEMEDRRYRDHATKCRIKLK